MATTTPNYGWPVPTSTDYVKDGATAIEALGDAIDATVFGLGTAGLTLVKSQVIGSAVSSVTVTGAFSATYDQYRVTINGGVGSTVGLISFTLGSATTGYYYQTFYGAYNNTVSGVGAQNQSSVLRAGSFSTNSINFNMDFHNPFLTKDTYFNGPVIGETSSLIAGNTNGYQASATSFTSITFSVSGTLTGGTIRVYGYKN